MTRVRYDVAIVGLGAMGSASAAHAARRGARTIGIERFERGHANGSSSGESRIIRKAYFEDPAYVPLLRRAYNLWHELEAQTARALVDFVGLLMVGAPDAPGIAGTLRTARLHDLPLDVLDAPEILRRYPGTRPHAHEIGLFEREAGMIFPEAAIDAQLDLAASYGADLRFGTRVHSWRRVDGAHRLVFEDGTYVQATRVILCAGMWTPELPFDLALPLQVQRNVQIWFAPPDDTFQRGAFPAFFVERPSEAPGTLYGFPAFNGTLKAALHRYGVLTRTDELDRTVHDANVAPVRQALDPWMPGAAERFVHGKVCAYTMTPDGNFVLDRHPRDASIVLACGFSGHGFKFAPVIGEICAALALDGGAPFDLAFLRCNRFHLG